MLKFYLDRQAGEIMATVYGEYGEEKYNLVEPASAEQGYRDVERENVTVGVLRRYFSVVDRVRGMYVLAEKDEDSVYNLVSEGIAVFQQMGHVYITEALKLMKVYRSPRVSVGVSLNEGMLDITLQSERFTPKELAEILSGYQRKSGSIDWRTEASLSWRTALWRLWQRWQPDWTWTQRIFRKVW